LHTSKLCGIIASEEGISMAWEAIYVRIDAELKDTLDQYCYIKRVSMREVVEEAIKNFLLKEGVRWPSTQ
jgi:hypothetical protein